MPKFVATILFNLLFNNEPQYLLENETFHHLRIQTTKLAVIRLCFIAKFIKDLFFFVIPDPLP